MMILLLVLSLVSVGALLQTVRKDGYGTRPGPRSPTDADRRS